jgi:tricarballylate dehydrogenase
LKAKKDGKNARVALIEVGKKGERFGALKLDDGINPNFEKDWMKEVQLVNKDLVDLKCGAKRGQTVPALAGILRTMVSLSITVTRRRVVGISYRSTIRLSGDGGNAIIQKMFEQCSHTPTLTGRQKRRSY